MAVVTQLSEHGRRQVAVALILWRDWRFGESGQNDWGTEAISMVEMADHLGVRKELDEILPLFPRMKITPRD